MRGMHHSTGRGFCLSDCGTGSTNRQFCPEQGIHFAHSDSGTRSGLRLLFSCQNRAAKEHCCCSRLCPAAGLLKHANFDLKVNCVSHFGTLQGIYYHHFVWNRAAKLCLFSLEQGQVPMHSAAHPRPKLRGRVMSRKPTHEETENSVSNGTLLVHLLERVFPKNGVASSSKSTACGLNENLI